MLGRVPGIGMKAAARRRDLPPLVFQLRQLHALGHLEAATVFDDCDVSETRDCFIVQAVGFDRSNIEIGYWFLIALLT